MTGPQVCAARDCDNEVVRRPGRVGRPPIYCSPGCRPSRTRPSLSVELDQDDGEPVPGRDWVVRLRRANQVVVVGRGLGRFSATAMATELRGILGGTVDGRGDQP